MERLELSVSVLAFARSINKRSLLQPWTLQPYQTVRMIQHSGNHIESNNVLQQQLLRITTTAVAATNTTTINTTTNTFFKFSLTS